MNKRLSRSIAFFLTVVLIVSMGASATAATEASDYLDSYSAYTYAAGSGKIQIWFDVTGTGTMNKIGALTIVLKESTDGSTWTTVQTFRYTSYSSMLASNKATHTSNVDYSGVSGRYYQAVVTVWAGTSDTVGDSRQITTSKVKA